MGVMHACTYPGCKKSFDRKYNLKCHLRIHSNEKPYRCHHAHCTRSFRWKSSLNHHLMSLDHTPLAARRERKARAAKRRQNQLAAAAAVAAAANVGPELHPLHAGLHHGNLTAASGLARRQQQHQQQRLPHAQPRTTVFNFHTMPLDTARVLDLSDVSIGSGQNESVNRDIQFLNNKTQLYMNHPTPYSGRGIGSPLTDDMPPTYENANTNRLQLQPSLVGPRPHNPVRRPHPTAWGQHYVPADHRRIPRQSRNFPLPPDRNGTGLVAESRPRDVASIDSALEQPLDSLCASLGAVKRDLVETSAVSQRCSIPADMAPLFINGDTPREPGFMKQAMQMQPCNQKMPIPLVSVFEDSSPISLLSTVGPALDPLFASCNFDAQSLRTF